MLMYIDHLSQNLVFETKNVDDLFEQGLWCLKIDMLIYLKKGTNWIQILVFNDRNDDISYEIKQFNPIPHIFPASTAFCKP